jgi:hypothetical protein
MSDANDDWFQMLWLLLRSTPAKQGNLIFKFWCSLSCHLGLHPVRLLSNLSMAIEPDNVSSFEHENYRTFN